MRIALLVEAAEGSAALRVLLPLFVCGAHTLAWTAAAGVLVRAARPRPACEHLLWKLSLFGAPLTTASSMSWYRLGASPATSARVASLASDAATSQPGAAALSWTIEDSPVLAVLAVLVIAGSVHALVRLCTSAWGLARALDGRQRVRDARLCARLSELQQRARLRQVVLTESMQVPGPLVIGRREVCLPTGALNAFTDEEVDAVLGHELAHLRRGDGIWFPVIALMEALLWAQPLTRWLATRVRQSAEQAADDETVALTKAPMALARAITRMAALQLEHARVPLVPAMATVSTRVLRVQRLVQQATWDEPVETRWARAIGRWPLYCLAPLALALPCLRAEWVAPTRALAAEALQPPDELAHREQLDELANQAWQLERELDEATSEVGATRFAELQQELRHVRGMQSFVEARFEAARGALPRRNEGSQTRH